MHLKQRNNIVLHSNSIHCENHNMHTRNNNQQILTLLNVKLLTLKCLVAS